jgi:hypothetical protein
MDSEALRPIVAELRENLTAGAATVDSAMAALSSIGNGVESLTIDSIFDDPGDGSVLVAVPRPPNLRRMMPAAFEAWRAAARPAWIEQMARDLDACDADTLAQIKQRMTRDILK